MRCLLFFPSSPNANRTVGRTSVRHCSTKGSASQLLRFEPTLQSGFTLIELLVVIFVLGIIAGAIVVSYDDVGSQAQYDTTKFEMAEIRKALLQFRRDSGSRDFPTQGVYDCSTIADEAIADGRPTTWSASVPVVSSISDKPDWVAWCNHPANFWMLFEDPIGNGWDQDTHRGWNGPYLQRKSGYLDIGNDLSTAGTGNPYAGTATNNVWAIASPFMAEPKNGLILWSNMDSSTATGYKEFDQHGSPYFMFDLADDDDNNSDSEARIVNMADDDIYDEVDAPNCEQALDTEDNPLDNILCLLR